MKVCVINDKCIGCGNCVALTEGQIFDFNDEGLAETVTDSIPSDMEETVKDAIAKGYKEMIGYEADLYVATIGDGTKTLA